MITKTLMGFGGRLPALDTRFVAVMCNQPLFMLKGIGVLTRGLEELGRRQLRTRGRSFPIPWERALDMALWQAGSDDAHWLC